MQPFPPELWARIQASAQGMRENQVTGRIVIWLNYQSGQVGSWDLSLSEHGGQPGVTITISGTT